MKGRENANDGEDARAESDQPIEDSENMRLYYPRNRFDASKIEEDGEKSRTTHTHKDLTRQLNNSMKFVVVMVWVIKIRRVLALIAFLFFSFLFFFFLCFLFLSFLEFFSPLHSPFPTSRGISGLVTQ